MSGQALPVAVFCLATGAALGCLFLLFQGMSQLLGLKKLGTALVDVLFCCLCGGFVFLCALAVDSGRLRLYQAALQGLGAWCVVAAFGPLARWGIARLRKIFGKLCSLLGRWAGIPLGHLRQGAATRAHPGKKTGNHRSMLRARHRRNHRHAEGSVHRIAGSSRQDLGREGGRADF